uniref:Ubiquitin-like protease family profile domain-containing protein n=1 Tax=Lactuca sativa TaxID=4236 RepID=A0A9R1X9I4_LACSA|nr:hypothetical protein LSAT_V11C500263220 [Lactuca sativa]
MVNRLSKRKGNDIIFMPYNPGRHWVLGVLDMKSDNCYYLDSLSSSNFNMEMVLYTTQSGSNKRVKLNWCPVQPGATECGYYMLRFMKEIVEEGIEVLVKDNQLTNADYVNMLFFIDKNNMQIFSLIGDGTVEYTTDDIDEIRKNGQSLLQASFIDDIYGFFTMYPQNNVMKYPPPPLPMFSILKITNLAFEVQENAVFVLIMITGSMIT